MNTNGSTFNVGDYVEYTGPLPAGPSGQPTPPQRGTVMRPYYMINWDAGSSMDRTVPQANMLLKPVQNSIFGAVAAGKRRRTKKVKRAGSKAYY